MSTDTHQVECSTIYVYTLASRKNRTEEERKEKKGGVKSVGGGVEGKWK